MENLFKNLRTSDPYIRGVLDELKNMGEQCWEIHGQIMDCLELNPACYYCECSREGFHTGKYVPKEGCQAYGNPWEYELGEKCHWFVKSRDYRK